MSPLLRDADVLAGRLLPAGALQLPPVLRQLALEELHHVVQGHVGEMPGAEAEDGLSGDLLRVPAPLHLRQVPVLDLGHEGGHGDGLLLGGHGVLARVDALADLVGEEDGLLVCLLAIVRLLEHPGQEKRL